MNEDTNQQQKVNSDSQSEGKTDQGLQPTNKPEDVENKSEGLPDNVKERTAQQFEKLQKSNKQLKSELEKLKSLNIPPVLNAYNTSISNQGKRAASEARRQDISDQYNETEIKTLSKRFPGIIDQEGYVDPKVLNRTLSKIDEAQKAAQRAERRVAEYEITTETKELHKQYPEVDPTSDKFSQEAYDLVKQKLLDQLMTNGKQDAIRAAKDMEKYFRSNTNKQQRTNKQNAEKRENERKQATVTVGNSGRSSSGSDLSHEELVRLSRRGDKRAIGERLKKSNY